MAHTITINDDKLYTSIMEYCKGNGLKLSPFCVGLLREAFFDEKYGDIPFGTIGGTSGNAEEEPIVEIPDVIVAHAEKELFPKSKAEEGARAEEEKTVTEIATTETAAATPVSAETETKVKPKKRRL